jgi:hypothetical protein
MDMVWAVDRPSLWTSCPWYLISWKESRDWRRNLNIRPGSAALDQLDRINRLDQLGLIISVIDNILKNLFLTKLSSNFTNYLPKSNFLNLSKT